MSTCLVHVASLLFRPLCDGLAIGHLGSAYSGVHLELTHQSIRDDLQVQLSHSGDHGLAGLGIGAYPEGGVFFTQAAQRIGHLVLVSLGPRLDGHCDDRFWKPRPLEHHRLSGVAERISGYRELEPHRGRDIAGGNLVHFLPMIRVHAEQPADSLLLVLVRVVDVGSTLDHTRINAQVRQFAHEWISDDFEREGGHRFFANSSPRFHFSCDRVDPRHRRHIDRRRQVIDDRV